jgi:succinate dehydrogenase/fumarate reductase flavoprotein subunit
MASSSPSRPASRRRQRSVRVTVAVTLMALATLAVLLALPTRSVLWLSISSVLALCCGWAAARIVYTELLQSRRAAAVDRAAQAGAYRAMFAERAGEHAQFTTAMTDRLVRRDREVQELQASVLEAQKRAIDAEARVQRESRRANQAMEQVAELQEALEIRAAEEHDELASWDGFDTGAETALV